MLDNIESSSTDVEIELETISNETPSVELPELAAGSNNNLHNHNNKETVHIYVNDCVCDDNREDDTETETETEDHYNEETETESEAEDLLEAEAGSSRRVFAPYFIQWQSPIVEWLSPIRDWQVAPVCIVYHIPAPANTLLPGPSDRVPGEPAGLVRALLPGLGGRGGAGRGGHLPALTCHLIRSSTLLLLR